MKCGKLMCYFLFCCVANIHGGRVIPGLDPETRVHQFKCEAERFKQQAKDIRRMQRGECWRIHNQAYDIMKAIALAIHAGLSRKYHIEYANLYNEILQSAKVFAKELGAEPLFEIDVPEDEDNVSKDGNSLHEDQSGDRDDFDDVFDDDDVQLAQGVLNDDSDYVGNIDLDDDNDNDVEEEDSEDWFWTFMRNYNFS